MASHATISDFLLTGCAIVPAVAICAGRPEVAFFSHVVLLFVGIGFAACESGAPFKNWDKSNRDKT